MANSAQKNINSTQKFIEIEDIVDDIIILRGGGACLVIEIEAANFGLLSAEEQDVKIYSYAALLNSLSFPVQIVIRSKKLNIANYLDLLEKEKTNSKNQLLANQIGLYKDFVAELVRVNTILDKKFFMIIPYSSLEKGLVGAKEQVGVAKSSVTEGKVRVELILRFEEKIRKGVEGPVIGLIKNLSALVNGVEAFWKTLKK